MLPTIETELHKQYWSDLYVSTATKEKCLYILVIMECAIAMKLRHVCILDKEGKPTKYTFKVNPDKETLFRLYKSYEQTNSVLHCLTTLDKHRVDTRGKARQIKVTPLIAKAFNYFLIGAGSAKGMLH